MNLWLDGLARKLWDLPVCTPSVKVKGMLRLAFTGAWVSDLHSGTLSMDPPLPCNYHDRS